MKYKDLLIEEEQLNYIGNQIKDSLFVEDPTEERFKYLGIQEYILLQVENFLNVYEQLKNLLETYYFEDNTPDFDLQEEILYLLGNEGSFSFCLPEVLHEQFKTHFKAFFEIQHTLEKELKSLNLIQIVSNDETLTEEEKESIRENDLKVTGERISLSVDNYPKFRSNLIELAKQKKYGKLLDLIFN